MYEPFVPHWLSGVDVISCLAHAMVQPPDAHCLPGFFELPATGVQFSISDLTRSATNSNEVRCR
jgi:hypothetical protein